MADGDMILHLRYPWQHVLLDAFLEFNPDQLPAKIRAAQGVISARLYDVSPNDVDERIALSDAMRSLNALEPRGKSPTSVRPREENEA
jgi:hypothetical protein